MVQLLKSNYENACNAYLIEFCKKHEFDVRDAEWVDVGGVANICDYYVSLADMMIDINKDAPRGEYWRYYDYATECAFYNLIVPSYDHWLRGCPTYSPDKIEQLRVAQMKIRAAEDEFKQLLNEIKGS